jgi:hypothetical protein
MKNDRVFVGMTSSRMSGLLRSAERRVLLCVPAVRREVAAAIAEVAARLNGPSVRVKGR